MTETVNVYVDGSVRKERNEDSKGYAGIGIYSPDASKCSLRISEQVDVLMTNNEAEYSALIYLFDKCLRATRGYHYNIMMDSELVVNQVNKVWPVKAKNLKPFYKAFWGVANKLHPSVTFTVMKVQRNAPEQQKANDLAQAASARQRIVGVKCVPEGTATPAKFVDDLGTDHATPMAFAPKEKAETMDSTDDTVTEDQWTEDYTGRKAPKPWYFLHHDILGRMVYIYKRPLGEDGRPQEGAGYETVLNITEELAIQCLLETQVCKAGLKTPDTES